MMLYKISGSAFSHLHQTSRQVFAIFYTERRRPLQFSCGRTDCGRNLSIFSFPAQVCKFTIARVINRRSVSAMANNAGTASGMDNVDGSKELGRLATNIVPHILNMYNCRSTAADYEIYAPNATFEDPLTQAHGVAEIKSAFYAIPKVFKEGRMVEYTVEEEERTPNSGEIRLHNLQHYKLLSKTIDMRSLIKLQVEAGKVVRHEDLWDKNPLWDRQTVKFPLVGRLAETWRRGNMMVTHVLMGFGKD